MLLRALSILILATAPAFAQDETFGVGDPVGGKSTATVTTETVGPDGADSFVGATVLSAVNVRDAPTSRGSTIIGTLQAGDGVFVRCSRGWCELRDGGYAAGKFLSLSGTAESFDVLQPPAPGSPSSGDAPPVTTAIDTVANPPVPANFDGLWTLLDPGGKPGMPLILKQTDRTVTGTLQGPDRLAKLTGEVQGSKLTFTYDMVNGKGARIASGSGFLNLAAGGERLTGVLMLNGLVISNIDATR